MTTPRAALAAALLLFAAACGGDDAGSPASTAAPTTAAAQSEFPLTLEANGGQLTIPEKPDAIVSLSPTATEVLFAIGAGPQVIAVDDQSNYPPEAPVTDLSGFTPNVEAIAGRKPDLVVIADDSAGLTSALGALDIPVLVQPAATRLDDTYAQITQLGQATGNPTAANRLVEDMKADIADIVASAPDRDDALTVYHELDPTFYSATSETFIGQIYELAGFENIADRADEGGAAGGYPQLSSEYIVQANPDVIVLADTKCCGQTAATVAARPGWSGLQAVNGKGVVEVDDDIASRWGPRVVDFLEVIMERSSIL
jgi:iron complex transport system substrate-binding protein